MNAEIISWSIAVELALPFIVLSIILSIALLKNKKNNKRAVRELIAKIKNGEEQQKQQVISFLTEKLAFDEKKAKSKAKTIVNERKFLFRNLISGLLDKNTEALIGLEEDLSRIIQHYHSLDAGVPKPPPESEEEKQERENIQELKQEVKMLKREVHVTLTTLNNIFGEFSSMFGEEVPDVEMTVEQIITAMENFSNKPGGGKASEEAEPTEVSETDELEADELEAVEEMESMEDIDVLEEVEAPAAENEIAEETTDEEDELDFSIDSELDDIDSALDELELGQSPDDDDEPSWGDAFEESGDVMDEDFEEKQ